LIQISSNIGIPWFLGNFPSKQFCPLPPCFQGCSEYRLSQKTYKRLSNVFLLLLYVYQIDIGCLEPPDTSWKKPNFTGDPHSWYGRLAWESVGNTQEVTTSDGSHLRAAFCSAQMVWYLVYLVFMIKWRLGSSLLKKNNEAERDMSAATSSHLNSIDMPGGKTWKKRSMTHATSWWWMYAVKPGPKFAPSAPWNSAACKAPGIVPVTASCPYDSNKATSWMSLRLQLTHWFHKSLPELGEGKAKRNLLIFRCRPNRLGTAGTCDLDAI